MAVDSKPLLTDETNWNVDRELNWKFILIFFCFQAIRQQAQAQALQAMDRVNLSQHPIIMDKDNSVIRKWNQAAFP